MRKYRFSTEQKFVLWRVSAHKCFWCGQPITFQELTIDHVLPEYLSGHPEKLHSITEEYGLDTDFAINDYCNWVPAHAHCNSEKGITVYPATPAFIKALETVKKRAKKAKAEERRLTKNLEKGELLGRLGVALEKGIISQNEVAAILHKIEHKRDSYEPIVITFGLNVDDVLTSGKSDLPSSYADLCDWLEQELVTQLDAALSCSFFYPEPSQRTGETLSIRLAFLQLELSELDRFFSPWWTILEIQYYSDVYADLEWTRQRYRKRLESASVIDDREFIEMLHRGGLLSGFRRITETDFRALALSQDSVLFQSDSYYDLNTWRDIFELAGLEDWEIAEALAKADYDTF